MTFDLDQAIEDFYFMTKWYGDYFIKYDYYAQCAIEAQFDSPIPSDFYNECLQKLKIAIGGYQMRMELD